VTLESSRNIRAPLVLTLLAGLLILPGCGSDTDLTRLTKRETSTSADNLNRAISIIDQLDGEMPQEAQSQLTYHLNRWIKEQPSDPGWNRDPLISRLPFGVDKHPDMSQLLFHPSDTYYLHECSWLHDIAGWAALQPLQAHHDRFSEMLPTDLSDEDQQQLLVACKLFDWTVRHIQLLPLATFPTTASADNPRERAMAAEMGLDGPGYTLSMHDVLSRGTGDAWQRGRAFIQLARQRQIEVVFLGLRGEKGRRSQPWLTAAVCGSRLYLFDNQLGLPVPGPGGQIATLADLRADPSLLEPLAVDGEPYRISAAELENLVALIDAGHCSLSQRMRILEQHLTGENQMVLSTSPGRISRLMRNEFEISRSELLPADFENYSFKIAFFSKIQTDPIAAKAYRRDEFLWTSQNNQLVEGRRLFFRGKFGTARLNQSGQGEQNAKTLILGSRLPNAQIAAIATSGENPDPEKVRNLQEMLSTSKNYASYWLGLIHMEDGNYTAAINWLENRALETGQRQPYDAGARYNLARCYEATGQHERARELLEQIDSPQAAGNKLLARQLAPAAADN
jgi:tetratricopeptide (TPR) repeat protein